MRSTQRCTTNQIESIGGSIGHVIGDGIERERFRLADVINRDVTVWQKVGIARDHVLAGEGGEQ